MLDDAFGLVLSNASPEMYEERGFELDIPRDEIKNIIHNVIGKYALVPRVYQMQNLNWFWRRVYEIYDAVRNAIKKCCICGG